MARLAKAMAEDMKNLPKGKTLRDEFAMAYVQGELASQQPGGFEYVPPNYPALADTAYEFADAMLAARDRGHGDG